MLPVPIHDLQRPNELYMFDGHCFVELLTKITLLPTMGLLVSLGLEELGSREEAGAEITVPFVSTTEDGLNEDLGEEEGAFD